MCPQLKVRLRCKACHAEERAAFRYTHPTPHPQLRKIKQIAPAEKSCVVGCEVIRGVGA